MVYLVKILHPRIFLIYGYGSDGLVSASKDILKILGDKDYFVNGYFSYDSKKSGGVTVSNLRIGKKKINAPYYVTNPRLIVVTKLEYFKKFAMIDNIVKNGTIIINTSKSDEEIRELEERHVKDWSIIKSTLKDDVRDFIFDKTKRNPMILPIIMEL